MFSGNRWRSWLAAVGAAGALVITTAPAEAQQKKPSYQDLERRIQRLERLLDQKGTGPDLYKKPSAVAPTAEAPVDQQTVENIVDEKLKKQKVTAGFKDGSGFFIESPSGDFKAKFRGLVQADSRWYPSNGGKTNNDNFYLRRARPIFEGTLFKYFDYKFTPDFGLGTTVIQDAYGDVNYLPYARIRSGKFKDPFSLERLQSASDVQFVERSVAENLSPNRDVGVQLFSESLFNGTLTYQLAGMNGNFDGGSNDGDTTNGKDVFARLFITPLSDTDIDWAKGFGVGLAGSFGQSNGDSVSSLNYRTMGRATWFKYNTSSSVTINTYRNRYRYAPQTYYYWGPFGFMAQGIFNTEEFRRTQSFDEGPNLSTNAKPFNYGWFAQASWVLTGENASYKGVTPINNFDPRNGRWGAFEVAFRASQANIDDVLFERGFASEKSATTRANEYTFGVNWYLNRALKFQLNYGRTNFANGISYSNVGPAPRDHEDVILTNFQVAF